MVAIDVVGIVGRVCGMHEVVRLDVGDPGLLADLVDSLRHRLPVLELDEDGVLRDGRDCLHRRWLHRSNRSRALRSRGSLVVADDDAVGGMWRQQRRGWGNDQGIFPPRERDSDDADNDAGRHDRQQAQTSGDGRSMGHAVSVPAGRLAATYDFWLALVDTTRARARTGVGTS